MAAHCGEGSACGYISTAYVQQLCDAAAAVSPVGLGFGFGFRIEPLSLSQREAAVMYDMMTMQLAHVLKSACGLHADEGRVQRLDEPHGDVSQPGVSVTCVMHVHC